MNDKNKNFVKVPHQWYQMDKEGISFMSQLGDKRFTLWFAINKVAIQSGMADIIRYSITEISNDMKILKGFSNKTKVRNMLIALKKVKLIECDRLNKETKPSSLISIKVNTDRYIKDCNNKGFSMISTDLYDDKIQKLDCTGFFIYCFLHKNHNVNLGNQDITNNGYCETTRDSISRILGIKNKKTITKYTNKIVKAGKLVKKIKQQQYQDENELGDIVTKWTPNRYIVWAKIDNCNKYYIPITSKKNKKEKAS
ncbi:hypothetical protein [Clostridiisalibacter paucivorans]|uniref:hypothetical protein n=1 Tax=Clostridiisalibacter paucivorans TaxID=408753 RepID=UPI00047CAFFA|nr:hypothetical protein [Clostridiisalibacter paucivorans]